MLGQFFSETDQKYNVIILAGGLGTRMGQASDHIPKALTRIGNQRAIDLIISKLLLVGRQFIVGTGWHADLLESYVKGRFGGLNVAFSQENANELRGNGTSLLYALDRADSRLSTIVTFCDLLIVSNPALAGSSMYLAKPTTEGVVGTFRHSVKATDGKVDAIVAHESPKLVSEIDNGVIGFFVFENTLLLKEIVYSLARQGQLSDITSDVASRYAAVESTRVVSVDALLEFGNEDDLVHVRKVWENF